MKSPCHKPGRSFLHRVGRHSAHLMVRAATYRINRLPEHVRRDIGWPAPEDLDDRPCS